MANYFTFGTFNSSNYKCYIARSNFFDAPSRDVTTVSVPGRNGDLHIDNGRFNSFIAKVYVYFTEDMQTNIPNVVNLLNTLTGEQKYAESNHAGFFRRAVFISAVEVDVSDTKRAGLELSFYCRPEKFLTSGETAIIISTLSAQVDNPTLFPAKPLITIYGAGTLIVGTKSIVTTAQQTTIDFDTMQAYNGTTNLNNDTTFPEIELKALSTTITLGAGITAVKMTPRWWQL